MSFKTMKISGWGNHPIESCNIYRPERIQDIKAIITSRHQEHYIMRGLGRSYGDTSLNLSSGVIINSMINRFISFDEETGILECESGVTLEEILEYFLPRGYFLPVTPGTKYVTLGGAIASDVHGKNHHKDGCISDHVLDINILIGTGDILHCSREENADLFWATIGGIGLTGIITTLRIKLIPVETAYIEVDYQKARNLDEALDFFYQDDDNYQYSVAWIDCLATGKSLGRSVLMRGNHAPILKLTPSLQKEPLKVKPKFKATVPFYLPSITLNQFTINLFNSVYYSTFRDKSTKVVDYDSFFYPLDSVLHWNRAYGKNGFVQYQAVFPPNTCRQGLVKLLEQLSSSKRSSFLAVLKSFGEGNKGLLSFPYKGYTLALDIPIKGKELFSFLRKLDELVLKHGGRVYLAKDSEISPELFYDMYPTWRKFKQIKEKIDPHSVFSSSMARRIGLMEG